MKKLALLVPGVGAAVAIAVIGAGQASAQAPNVIGETYGKAVALLRASGYTAVFAGPVGSDLPQSQCIVIDQQGQSSTNTWNPTGTAQVSGLAYPLVLAAMRRAIADAQADFGIVGRVVPAIDREAGAAAAMEMLQWVLDHRCDEAPGIGIDYQEAVGPPQSSTGWIESDDVCRSAGGSLRRGGSVRSCGPGGGVAAPVAGHGA